MWTEQREQGSVRGVVLLRLELGPLWTALPSSPTLKGLPNPSCRMLGLLPTLVGRESEVLRCSGTCVNVGLLAGPAWGLRLAFLLYLLLQRG